MTIKLRAPSSTKPITADEIHQRVGGTSGDEVDFNDIDVVQLTFVTTTTTTAEKNFQQFHNAWKLVTGDYFNTTGYVENFQGSADLGSMTANIIASVNDEGFYLGANATEGRITELTADTTTYTDLDQEVLFFKYVNNANGNDIGTSNVGWTNLTFRTVNFGAGGGNTDIVRLKSSYASFNSSTKKWSWTRQAGHQTTILGTSSGLTRYIQIN